MVKMIDLKELIGDLIRYTRNINWSNYYAKWSKNHKADQSLLVHSINQASLLEFLTNNIIDFDVFTEQEKIILMIAAFFSDAGKSQKSFQDAAIHGSTEAEAYNHINIESLELVERHMEFLKDTFKAKYSLFKNDDEWKEIKNEIKRNICYHQRVKAPDLKDSCGKYGGAGPFSPLIDYIDDLTSIKNIEDAYIFAIKKDGVEHLMDDADFTFHKLSRIRGILTVLLNETLIQIHKKFGYEPILYYSDGVIYAARKKNKIDMNLEDIIPIIDSEIKKIVEDERFQSLLIDITFGPITQTIVLFPALLNKSIVRKKILNEIKRSSASTTIKKFQKLFKEKAITKKESEEYEGKKYIDFINELGNKFKIIPDLVIECFSKFQSAMTYAVSVMEEYIKWGEEKTPEFRQHIEKLVQKYFPFINYDLITRGYANVAKKTDKINMLVDFWKKSSEELWITSLGGIENFQKNVLSLLDEIYDEVRENKPTLITMDMIDDLLMDVSYSSMGDMKHLYKDTAVALEEAYLAGKQDKKNRACFFCGLKYYNDAIKEKIGEGPRKFSNKLIGGKRVTSGHQAGVCKLCESEATLRKIIMGTLPSEIILLTPELNMGIEMRHAWEKDIKVFINSRAQGISLLNEKTLSKVIKQIALADEGIIKDINAKWISENIIIGKEKRKKYLQDLKENYGDINEFNKMFETHFGSYKDLLNDVLMGDWWHENLIGVMEPAGQVEYLYQTPNYILIFLRFELKNKDEPNSSGYIKKLFYGILLSIIFNARIKFIESLNPILHYELENIVSTLKTALTDSINKCINPDDMIAFHNRFVILKRIASLMALEEMFSKPENDFLLKYMKYSRGFILNKIRIQETRINMGDLLNILENFPKYKINI